MENLFSPTRATVAMASGEPGAPGFSGASTSAPKASEILAPPPSRVARGPEAAFAVEVLSMPVAVFALATTVFTRRAACLRALPKELPTLPTVVLGSLA